MADFNPGFSFDVDTANEPQQAPWEFSGALKQVYEQQVASNATSIDHKIKSRLEHKQKQQAKAKGRQVAAAKPQPVKGKKRASSDSDDDDDSDDEMIDDSDDEEDSEDEPLPGELDEDDDEEEEEDDEMIEDDDDEDDEEEEEEEEDGAAASGDVDEDADEDDEQIDSEAEDEEEEAAAGSDDEEEEEEEERPQKRQKTSQQQQQQQQPKPAAAKGGKKGFFAETPEGTTFKAASFQDLNLSRPLLKACTALGYTTPTPIQAACIPLALTGRDVCGSAVTGSGKTAAFSLPILERLLHRPRQVSATYVLVLTPTRELAVQIHSMMQKLGQFTDIQVALIVGGLSSQVQASVLRKCPEIVVATPGRMIDHLRNTQSFGLEDLNVLVLDEADRLLEMGFKEEVMEIVRMTPRKRQTLLFSATFSEEVRRLVSLSLHQPVRLAADAAAAVPRELTQQIVRLKGGAAAQKEAVLLSLCSRSFAGGRTICFFRTKQRAHRMKILFGLLGLPPAAELHGDMTQAARLESLEAFRKGEVAFLLATDVAARGLDIIGVQVVVNFDAPAKLESYLHRIGRTARAGASGQAVTLVEDDDRKLLKEVVRRTGVQLQQRVVPQQAVEQWQTRVEDAAADVSSIYRDERIEKELRQAEMEANKMQNMLEHEDEIKARPPRTWFQSERQKREAAKMTASEAAGQESGDEDEGEGGKKKGKDSKAVRKEKLKQQKAAAGPAKRKDKLKDETEEFSKNIRAAKSKQRALREQGFSSSKAAKMAAASTSGTKKKKAQKPKSGLFSGDGINKPGSGSGEGGAKGAGSKAAGGKDGERGRKDLSKTDLNRMKRGGVGKKAFKSKARFKRR